MKKKILAIAIAAVLVAIGLIVAAPAGLDPLAWRALMIFLAGIVLMVLEALPMSIIALSMLCIMVWSGASGWGDIYANFGVGTMLFMFGTYACTAALQNTSIPLRIANAMTKWSRGNSRLMVLFFMLASGVVSSMMSNLATMAVFVGVSLRVIRSNGDPEPGTSNLGRCLMIGCALGSAVGGFASPIGVAHNLTAWAMLEQLTGMTVTFADWMAVGYPVMIVVLVLLWLMLTMLFKPEPFSAETTARLAEKNPNAELGKLDAREIKAIVIIGAMIACWIGGSWVPALNGVAVALIGTALFMVPGIEVFNWKQLNDEISWNMLFMCGAIMSLVAILTKTGASAWIVESCLSGFGNMPALVVFLLMTLLAAVLRVLFPLGAPLLTLLMVPYITMGMNYGFNPAVGLMIVVFWASCGIVLPFDALPAIGYGYGYFSTKDYIKQGVISAGICVVATALLLGPLCNLFMA